MLVDADILLYSLDERSPFHEVARDWLTDALNGPRRVGIPRLSAWAFIRIVTNPRAVATSLTPTEALEHVSDWLDSPASWTPEPGAGHRDILARLLVDHDVRAGLVTDAVLAAIAIEHGLDMVSADSDFARFGDVRWINPLDGT